MAFTLKKSVGQGGVNLHDDVLAVQHALNGFVAQLGLAKLAESGVADAKTIAAILAFQDKIVGLTKFDGEIDPGGRTATALAAGPVAPTPAPKPTPAPAPKPTPTPAPKPTPAPTSSAPLVAYSASLAPAVRIVSPYSFGVIQKALAMAGMTAGVITSTLRFPSEQAGIMYDMATIDLAKQYALYAAAGDKVLDVFKANQGKPRATVVDLMEAKIEQLLSTGVRVSKHVVRPVDYAKLNVIDIGVNSTKAAAGASFNKAGLTAAFTKLKAQGVLSDFIDETTKSNNCWHLEIAPGA